MNQSRALILLTFCLLGCWETKADQLTLKNGDRVSGIVIKADGKDLVLKSDLMGEVKIALENVTAITSDRPLYVGLGDGRTVVGVVAASDANADIKTSTGLVSVNRSSIVFIRNEAEQLAYEKSLKPGLFEQWTGGADLGIALTKGNSDTTNIALGLGMTRESLRDKTSIYAASIYNRDSTNGVSRTVANTIRFGVRYDRNFHKRWFGYGFTDLEKNALQELNLRWVLGGGVGYHAIRNERTELDLLGGLAMNREYFKGFDNDRTSLEAQIGQTLSQRVTSRMSLKEQLFFFPNLSNGGEYRINFDTSLVTDITKRIGWQLTLSDRYLSDPPFGLKQNDLLLTTGIHVKLGILK
jgi:putative salt-induced outer membrane protein YdiY